MFNLKLDYIKTNFSKNVNLVGISTIYQGISAPLYNNTFDILIYVWNVVSDLFNFVRYT